MLISPSSENTPCNAVLVFVCSSISVSVYVPSVNNVISAILKHDGNIASIKTNDPTLEDVFVAITAKKRKEIK
jgi:hypothetical protein